MCRCNEYGHLEFERKGISKRIRETPALKKLLELIAKSPDGHKLYRCPACEQLWQCSRAWNWGNKDYLFKVPDISVPEWTAEPYVHPSDLFEFGTVMSEFLNGANFTAGGKRCSVSGCSSRA